MLLPALLVTDTHLTANPSHSYRWRLFEFLADQCRAEQVQTLVHLGDLSDAKDYHPSELVTRTVAELVKLREVVPRIRILMGNHDYLRKGHAYFSFLNHIPGLRFITEPWEDMVEDGEGPACLYLPHTRTPSKDWAALDTAQFDYVFMHQTVGGSKASNGQEMEGDGCESWVSSLPKVYSGDIHVPQKIKHVEYVGSPYHVHFGDNFTPRCVLIDRRNRPVDISTRDWFPKRVKVRAPSLDNLKRHRLRKGDHVKLVVELDAAEAHEWARVKREAVAWLEGVGVEVHGIGMEVKKSDASSAQLVPRRARWLSDDEVVEHFVREEDLGGDVLEAGMRAMR